MASVSVDIAIVPAINLLNTEASIPTSARRRMTSAGNDCRVSVVMTVRFLQYITVSSFDGVNIVAQGRAVDVCTKELLADIFRIDADIIFDKGGKPNILYKTAL